MLLCVTTWVLSSFPKGLNKEETVREEVGYIYSTCLPRQDIWERKILWSTRNNTSHERQAEETRLPGNQLLSWTRKSSHVLRTEILIFSLDIPQTQTHALGQKKFGFLSKNSLSLIIPSILKKYWKTTTTTKKPTKPTRQESFTTCTCTLSERHMHADLFQETSF